MQHKWVKFPNGKAWRIDENGWAEGSVVVSNYEDFDSLEGRLDAIAEEVTGSSAGLTNFSYRYRGNDIIAFCGDVSDMLESEETTQLTEFFSLYQTLKAQYGLSDIEVEHALDTLGNQYPNECTLEIGGSYRQIRCPAFPDECSYIRIVVDSLEIAYWDKGEWHTAPAEIMGAIIGAARGNGEAMASLATFELVLQEFDGSTDETDNLVLWVSAPSKAEVEQFIAANGLSEIVEFGDDLSGHHIEGDGIDFQLPAQAEQLKVHLHALLNASTEILRAKWEHQVGESDENRTFDAWLAAEHPKRAEWGGRQERQSMPTTNPDDWVVSGLQRVKADYDDRIDLISFGASHKSSPVEQLDRIPMERGITETGIRNWLANLDARTPQQS